MAYKFKLHDRVRVDWCEGSDELQGVMVGDTGEVLEEDSAPLILMDKNKKELYMMEDQLSLIEQSKATPSPKFSIGQKVVVVDDSASWTVPEIRLGSILTVKGIDQGARDAPLYSFEESTFVLYESCLEAYTQEKTAEEIAPTLWQSYCNVLNEEALAALRQVIEDVKNHGKVFFEDKTHVAAAFCWPETEQGRIFWASVADGLYNKTEDEKIIPIQRGEIDSTATNKPVKSDGGSSDYYKISIKTSHGMVDVEVNDVIYAMVGGDFDLANVLKAARRMYLASKGCGKEGVDITYDARKIAWFCDDFVRRFGDVDRSEK